MKNDMTILGLEEQAVFSLRRLYRQYGYLPYKMSRFEEYDLYVRNKDFLPSQQIITFADRSGKLLALKPDVTLSIIKNAPDAPGVVQKLFYNESVYRADPASHALKEILQSGLECVGDLGSYEISEVLLLAAKSLSLLGDSFVLDISHTGLISAVLDSCKIPQERRKQLLRCLEQKSAHELLSFCPELSGSDKNKLLKLINIEGTASQALEALEPVLTDAAELSAFRELQQLCGILCQSGFGGSIRIDLSVGTNMKYYNGVVFKGYLQGLPSSILSGGQYDKLLSRMNRSSRAIGFALYLSMLEVKNENRGLWDIDTLIIHDGSLAPGALLALSQKASAQGSVLVASTIPENRRYRHLIQVNNGEVSYSENA